jgi:hypothetical protein
VDPEAAQTSGHLCIMASSHRASLHGRSGQRALGGVWGLGVLEELQCGARPRFRHHLEASQELPYGARPLLGSVGRGLFAVALCEGAAFRVFDYLGFRVCCVV